MRLPLFFLLLAICFGHCYGMMLSKDGTTDYVIVVASDAISSERIAASELQSILKEVTGAHFPVKPAEKVSPAAKKIIVGPNDLFKQKFPNVRLEELMQDGIVIKTLNNDLYLAGGRPRGSLYAVYTFLEEYVGCRWWTSKESHIPKESSLTISDIDKVYVPPFQFREAFYGDIINDGVFAARLKNNGHYTIIGLVHTFDKFLPAAEYFEDHPEWYSLVNGERRGGQRDGQLCLTNPEVKTIFTQRVLEKIKENPGAGIISVSQNDNKNSRCQCEKCLELERLEGSPSGPIIHFVNYVAEEVEKQYPDFLVETLAYHYSQKPPLHVRPRDNVLIRLCSINCSFAQPLTSDQNYEFCKDIKGWSNVAKQLFVWDYTTNFSNFIFPHPNLKVLAPNIRLFEKFNTMGLFEQGDAKCTIGDFVELKAWLISHLMWDPSIDEEVLINEFLQGYYGDAAESIGEYLELIHACVERENTFLKTFMPTTDPWFKLEDMNEATKIFNEAIQRVAGNDILEARVRKAKLSFDLLWIINGNYFTLKSVAEQKGKEFLGPADPAEAATDFIETAKKHNVVYINTINRTFFQLEQSLREFYIEPAMPPVECQGLPREQWLDVQESSFHLYRPGEWTEVVDDPLASNGKAVRMPGSHFQWATQYDFTGPSSERTRVYLVIRVEANNNGGTAFTTGVYDVVTGIIEDTKINIEDTSSDSYITYDLGLYDMNNKYVYVAPPGNDDISSLYIDRMFFIYE